MIALNAKPVITPKMSRVSALPVFPDTYMTSRDVSNAPAAAETAMVSPAAAPAPPARVTAAAPRPAPELTPIIWGSARGFLKTACICAPARARAAPDTAAVTARGIRRSLNTSAGASPPIRMSARTAATRTAAIAMDDFPLFISWQAKLIRRGVTLSRIYYL